ncbi:hypothetical protein CWI37_0447p0010 [Hamiltosporidium tvaerminnensis]|uniref:Uncharacterized protein n=1 Tax=Hamiltosporidium tvaerminnensis TaxID=1176355 RepID=A0A4Q9L610_9MICR|nr:hypothetical protein CWI37_0447p0010 [Hamiltosporidium tvaerminnensis]
MEKGMYLVYILIFKYLYISAGSNSSDHIYSNIYETIPYDQIIPSMYVFSDRLNNLRENDFLLEFISFNMAANLVFCGAQSQMVSRKKNRIYELLKQNSLSGLNMKRNHDIFTKYQIYRSHLNNKLLSIEYLVILRLKFKIEKILKRDFRNEIKEFTKNIFLLNPGITNIIKERFKNKIKCLNSESQNIPQIFLQKNFQNCEMTKYFKDFDISFCDMNSYSAIPYLDVLSTGIYLSYNLKTTQTIFLYNLNDTIFQTLYNNFLDIEIIRKSIKVIIKMIYDTKIETEDINEILKSDFNLKFYQIYKKTFKNLESAYMNVLIKNILNKKILSNILKSVIREIKENTI